MVILTAIFVMFIPTLQLPLLHMMEDGEKMPFRGIVFCAALWLVPVAAVGLWKTRRWAMVLMVAATLLLLLGGGLSGASTMAVFPFAMLASTLAALRFDRVADGKP